MTDEQSTYAKAPQLRAEYEALVDVAETYGHWGHPDRNACETCRRVDELKACLDAIDARRFGWPTCGETCTDGWDLYTCALPKGHGQDFHLHPYDGSHAAKWKT